MDEGLVRAAETLAESNLDLPFVLFYKLDAAGRQAMLVAQTGLKAGGEASPISVDLSQEAEGWPLAEVAATGKAVEFSDVCERLSGLVCDPYPEPISSAFVLPVCPPGWERPACIMVAGASPRLPVNEAYRAFYDLLAAAVTTVVANASPTRQSESEPRLWPRSTVPRRLSSATSVTSSALR